MICAGYPDGARARTNSNLDDGVAVKRYQGIVGHQPHRLDKRLGHQDTVEWVLMVRSQFFNRRRMLGLDGQESIPGLAELTHRILAGHRHASPAKSMLDGDLPNARGTYPDGRLRRLDHIPRILRQLRAIGNGPQGHMRIQQQVQDCAPPMNSRATSSL